MEEEEDVDVSPLGAANFEVAVATAAVSDAIAIDVLGVGCVDVDLVVMEMDLVVVDVAAPAPDNTRTAATETDLNTFAKRCRREGLVVEADVGPLLPVKGAVATGASIDANKLMSVRRPDGLAAIPLCFGIVVGSAGSLVSASVVSADPVLPDRTSAPDPKLGRETSDVDGVVETRELQLTGIRKREAPSAAAEAPVSDVMITDADSAASVGASTAGGCCCLASSSRSRRCFRFSLFCKLRSSLAIASISSSVIDR